ncbi:MAG TPA: HAMP domain-containing sensor histidine kinase, partial [Chitinophagaceae bacterium]
EQKQELEKITKQVTQLNIQLEQKVQDRTKMLRETLAELEKSKEELSEALETEKELGELKSRFVTMASHEFRTPLSTILSSAFLLEKYNDPAAQEKRSKHIQRIRNAVSGMKSILEDFLSLGKLEEGTITAQMEILTSTECFIEIEDTIHEMEHGLKSGQKIIFQHNGDGVVYADKRLLKNILLNLLSNAIKFSPENSVIQVICSVEKELLISVKDTGIGISEEDKQHLFERFFRAKNAGNVQGTGLGLHIVTKYLELMRGTIEMESKLNEGSCFKIHIPGPLGDKSSESTRE